MNSTTCPVCGDPLGVDGKCDCLDRHYQSRTTQNAINEADGISALFDREAVSRARVDCVAYEIITNASEGDKR